MFPFFLALLFILKIRLGVQSNILEFIKKCYGGDVLLNISAYQDISIPPRSSIPFEDSPRR